MEPERCLDRRKERYESGKRAVKRAGSIISWCIQRAKDNNNKMSGIDAQKIHDSYGVGPYFLVLLCKSHDIDFDFEEYDRLVTEHENMMKKSKLC